MRRNTDHQTAPAEKVVKGIRRAPRRQYSAEEEIRIVLAGLRGEDSIAELCRREGINQNLHYRWSKDFLEAGKKRLAGDAAREATSDEVRHLRREAMALAAALDFLTEIKLARDVIEEMENLPVPDSPNVSDHNASGHFCDVWSHPHDHRPSRHATVLAEHVNQVDEPFETRFTARCR